jgi:hypothetical protein
MGDSLKPRGPAALPVPDVARRLREAFSYVSIDETAGLNLARKRAAWIEKAPAAIFLGKRDEALQQAKALNALELGGALVIDFGDSPEKSVQIVVLPDEAIQFGYRGEADRLEQRGLVERCAAALDCDIEAF